jgi:hypothetical protein
VSSLEAARFLIRCALEEDACWVALHDIVEDERERLCPRDKALGFKRPVVYSGPTAHWVSRRAI